MKSLKFLVLAILIMIGASASVEAALPCDSINESLVDSISVINTYGKPGDGNAADR